MILDPRKRRALRTDIADRTALVALIGLLLASCDAIPVRTPTTTSRAAGAAPFGTGVAVTATGSPPAPASATQPTPLVSSSSSARTRYALSVHFDYMSHHLSVEQVATYVNSSSQDLAELLFVVESNRQPNVFRLTGLAWAGGQAVAGYALDGALLRVPLPASLRPGQAVTLSLSYELSLPAQASPFGYTPRQTNLGDWYPFVPPYTADRGWLIHEPGAIGEHLVYDVADYQVEIVLAGPMTGIEIAAGGVMSRTDHGVLCYQLPAARSFAWSASHEYRVLTEQAGATTVVAYVLPEHQVAGEAMLQAVASALAIYSERFVPYPYAGLTVVESEFPDGMEYHGLFFLGQEYLADYDGGPQGYLTAIAVHETAHQWWYGLTGNDQAIAPWLDEALATYSELLFYETAYPDLTDWWWSFRVRRFNPTGWVNSAITDHAGFRPYVDAVYLRGAMFLDGLRKAMGDERFFAFLQAHARQGELNQMTTADFFNLLPAHTEADLKPLISEYFGP